MLGEMLKKFLFILLFFNISVSYAEVVKSIVVNGNERITSETVIVFSNVKVNDNLDANDLNDITKNLYSTDFFKNVSLEFENNILQINLKENYLVQNVAINGVKNKNLNEKLKEQLSITEKKSYVDSKVKSDQEKLYNYLKISGYYFAEVELDVLNNSNKTIDLVYNINLNKKAIVKKINFTGDKVFKTSTLSRIIITEEDKFWKFLSKKKYLNERQIQLDQRLLKNFYLNEGYYNVKITQSSASIIENNNFLLTYNINSGDRYFFNELSLVIPTDYNPDNFKSIEIMIEDIKTKPYSNNSINKLLNEIDKIAASKQFEFINASFKETIVDNNKINIDFVINETQKLYVNRIDILGNDITNETAIRNLLVVDEGDPINEILNNKSINNIKSSGLFSNVDYKIVDTDNDFKKNIEITVVEQPTGEISAGAGYGTSGQTFNFGIKENNFKGDATRLNTNQSISATSIKGGLNISIPNYRYSDKSLKMNISRADNDFFDTAGYKNTVSNFTVGTGFEYKQDLFFEPLLLLELEDLETNSTASQALRNQDGNYNNIDLDYTFLYDKRNQSFRPSDGFYSRFNQNLPLISNDYSLYNSYDFKNYHKISKNMIGSLSFHISAINSLDGSDVRISDRINISSRKLRGFEAGKIGPKDNLDFVGGNYASAMTLATTLPNFLPELDSIDFSLFLDAGNVWGVDYNDSLDNSKIRSATGLSIDWLTPVGPLNFVFSQPITKSSTDIEEKFRFDLGTTF